MVNTGDDSAASVRQYIHFQFFDNGFLGLPNNPWLLSSNEKLLSKLCFLVMSFLGYSIREASSRRDSRSLKPMHFPLLYSLCPFYGWPIFQILQLPSGRVSEIQSNVNCCSGTYVLMAPVMHMYESRYNISRDIHEVLCLPLLAPSSKSKLSHHRSV